jgi:hypothetical protein
MDLLENVKLHTSLISWMVHLMIKSSKEKPSESWDQEFLQLSQEVRDGVFSFLQ